MSISVFCMLGLEYWYFWIRCRFCVLSNMINSTSFFIYKQSEDHVAARTWSKYKTNKNYSLFDFIWFYMILTKLLLQYNSYNCVGYIYLFSCFYLSLFFDCFRSYSMISEFGFLTFILFFVYNLATGTVSIMWPSPCPRRTSCTNSPRSAAAGGWFSMFLYKYRYCNIVSVFNSSGNQVYYYNACELFNDLYSISLVFFHRHFNPLCCHEYSIIMLPRF